MRPFPVVVSRPASCRSHALGSAAARAALVALALLAPVAAQRGPGVPRLVYPQSELFEIIATIRQPQGPTANHGNALMHDGYLAVFHASPGGVEFYDIANPYEPRMVQSITSLMGDLAEPHAFAQTNAYGGQHVILMRGSGGLGVTGFAIWDWSDIFAPVRVRGYNVPGVTGGYTTGIFWLFYQAPYVYCPAGSLGLFIVDATDPANPFVANQIPTSRTGGFNAVVAIAIGNMLVLTNSDGGPGVARLDIGNPLEPQLLESTMNAGIPYGALVNGSRLLVAGVSGPIATSGGQNGHLEVRDLLAPSFPLINQLPLPSRGGFLSYQDGFVHVGASTAFVEIDIRDDDNYTLVGSASASNPGGDEDYATAMGNLTIVGDDQGFGTELVPHRALPDNTGPAVTMVVPADGATDQALTTRVGLTMSDTIELLTIDENTFSVRVAGSGQPPLRGTYSNQFGIVNFTPDQPLQANTTYEVVVPAGGMKDWSGNGVPATFTSRFSTGPDVRAIVARAQRNAPALPGQVLAFAVGETTGPGPFSYSWDFGDGTARTPFSSASQATHAYARAGHYTVLLTVTNGAITGTDSFIQTVHDPLTPLRPTQSSTIVLDEARGRAWCVNADNDTVTAIDTSSYAKVLEVAVGAHPRTLALAPDGTVWVACQDDATVCVLEPAEGRRVGTISLPHACAPYGIAMSPDGSAAWVTLRATGAVAKLDPAQRTLVGTVAVGPEPKGIAVAADSERIFVTRFLSSSELPDARPGRGADPVAPPDDGGDRRGDPVAEVYELSASAFAPVRTIPLAFDPGPDTEASGRGLPNYLSSAAITPDGKRLWVPSKKDNIARGMLRSGEPLDFESTVRAIVSQIDLATSREDLGARTDFNDREGAFAVAFSPLGDYAFHVLQGSNAVVVRDAYSGSIVAAIEGTGLAPQGLAVSSDGRTLFVHNFMSRTVGVHDIGGVTSATSFAIPDLANIHTVADERLSAQVLHGKQIFYNANDPRMNEDGYLSCASCHLDGGHDGRTWDFTDRGEGLRNTTSLLGKAGTGHGNVHWTANFDEIQDFENDMRFSFGGSGFMSNQLFESSSIANPLGHPKAGISPDLDALAAYVSSLSQFGASPHRDPSGALTAAGQRGRTLFQQLACAQCHSGPTFTDSPSGALHDVGTLTPASGQAIGGPLTGLDTPTLRGLWATAPYLHDGSAPTLRAVLTTRNPQERHGATQSLTPAQLDDLVAYLLQIDDREPGP